MPATRPVIAAGVILRRRVSAGDRWLLLRATKHREWGFPKGHQDPGESMFQTALRECAEESGIAVVELEGDPYELIYPLPDGRTKRVVLFPAFTRSAAVTLSDEHDLFVWADATQVVRRLPHRGIQSLFTAYRADLRQRLRRAAAAPQDGAGRRPAATPTISENRRKRPKNPP